MWKEIPFPDPKESNILLDNMDLEMVFRRAIIRTGSRLSWCKQHGMDDGFITHILQGKKQVSPRILSILGYERVTMYRKL